VSTETFIYVPLGQADERVTQVEPKVIHTEATIGEWRSWGINKDGEMVVTEQSAGWDDEEWNEAMRIKNGAEPKS
jgi:hypothetical protein